MRVLLVDDHERVLLVRHTYTPGWMLPGGGVEHGQTCLDAVRCELDEEVGVTLTEPPVLMGVLANFVRHPGDHVVLYHARNWRQEPRFSPEIAEAALFPLRSLPEGTTPATRRRIAEFCGKPVGDQW
ncbi:ADP-ribose pyrophosphatase YjhB (NUDIX family) [Rhodoligotrophos appendicifer]|uniref:NUDIX domain-containing protein n=1 Tax=Rhodoligotrophos appendicifer TaxID=987056 RepID=UPI001FE28B76|nr:NUDIX domain-containing protein [Rhodoligotrophos appendicifer]